MNTMGRPQQHDAANRAAQLRNPRVGARRCCTRIHVARMRDDDGFGRWLMALVRRCTEQRIDLRREFCAVSRVEHSRYRCRAHRRLHQRTHGLA